VSLSSFCSHSAPAQTVAPQPSRAQAFDLIQQGHLDLAITVLEQEVEAPNRSTAQRGRSYALLGYAYKEQGKFEPARRAFDRALRLIEIQGKHSSDYAGTLDVYAGLLMTTGNLESASKALHEAAAVDLRLANHGDLARIYSHTAELEIEQKKYKKAKEALSIARREALLSSPSGSTILPDIDSTSGWLAVSTGKFNEGISAYSTALAESRQEFGERNAVTGWSYLLLGKAEQLDHDFPQAARSMERGLEILKESMGTTNIRYLTGELAYSDLLDHAGSHAEALRVSSAANRSLKGLGVQPCTNCTVSVWSLQHQER
jgi:hypothetical protein